MLEIFVDQYLLGVAKTRMNYRVSNVNVRNGVLGTGSENVLSVQST